MKLRDLTKHGAGKPSGGDVHPFSGIGAGHKLTEAAFLANQDADPQHKTMGEMKASLGLPAFVREVAETPGKRAFSGDPSQSLGYLGTVGSGTPVDTSKIPGVHVRRRRTPNDLFAVETAEGKEAPGREVDNLSELLSR